MLFKLDIRYKIPGIKDIKKFTLKFPSTNKLPIVIIKLEKIIISPLNFGYLQPKINPRKINGNINKETFSQIEYVGLENGKGFP